MRFAVVLLLVAACGRLGFDARGDGDDDAGIDAPPAPFVPRWKSGTRIRARVLRAMEGGDPIRIGWHDTNLDTLCESALAADGVERCLPSEVRIFDKYSDAACTIPIAVAIDSACGGTDRYAFEFDNSNQVRVFPLTGVHTGTVYSTNTGACAPEGLATFATPYTLGTEVAPTMFIETFYENRIINGYTRIARGFSDGAEDLLATVVVGGRECAPTLGGLGASPCREPQLPSLTRVYLDAACTSPAYLSPGVMASSSFHVEEPQVCGTAYKRYAVAGSSGQATHYVKTLAGCAATATGSAQLYGGVENDPFPMGVLSIAPRRGRLGRLTWTSDDGGAVVDLFAYDHERGLPCWWFRGSDQILRCLPAPPQASSAIPDASCAGAATSLVGGCFSAEPLRGPSYTSCRDLGFAVRDYTAVGSVASADIDGVCTALAPAPFGVHTVGGLSNVVPPDMFPELVETIE